MVNRKKVEGLLATLNSYIGKLQILSVYSKQAFLSDFTKVESAKHLLQVSVECCLNISHHIIASERFRSPKSYADAFVILTEEFILPEEFLPTLQQMAQFRNRLVHLYWEIDEEAIYDILQKNLGDFSKFINYVLSCMDSETQEENPK